MADEADMTADRDELEAPMRIAASRKPVGPPATGVCHWCEEPVGPSLRYCDADCRDDHARYLRRKGEKA